MMALDLNKAPIQKNKISASRLLEKSSKRRRGGSRFREDMGGGKEVFPANKKTRAKLEQNRSKTRAKPEQTADFLEVVGMQKKLLEKISGTIDGHNQTPPLSMDFFSSTLNRSHSSIKKGIQALEKKGFLKRIKFKHGPGGWTQYEIPSSILNGM